MEVYLIALLLLIALFVGLIFWIARLFSLYRKGKKQSLAIQFSILIALVIFLTWKLQIFPLSKTFYIREQTTALTGKTFWSWREFSYDEIGVRGEGYTLNIYKFSEETADYFEHPDPSFFDKFPPDEFADVKWTDTPVRENEQRILEFVTPKYAGWEGEIVDRQDFIRQIASQPGSYYSFDDGGGTNFYLIAPDKRLVILINHNM